MRRLLACVVLAVSLFSPCAALSGGTEGAHAAAPSSSECTAAAAPVIPDSKPAAWYSRIYLGSKSAPHFGDGKRASDPLDASTAEKFDAILRKYSGNPVGDPAATPPIPAIAPASHLIVCLGPGVFQTEGNYDFVINLHHGSERGFAVGPYWHIHGEGIDRTTVQLVAFVNPAPNSAVRRAWHPGVGIVFHTVSDSSRGVEISDMTIDLNYPNLKPRATQMGIEKVNLEAIHLRSDQGGHYIHHIRVLNAAGEIVEAFPVEILSVNDPPPPAPAESTGNLIEHVTMDQWAGGKCTAIALANVQGAVRFNSVHGYFIGYGGWNLHAGTRFHDNQATDTAYGFNIDSLTNTGVVIERNQIAHPSKYGIVIGEAGTFSKIEIVDNSIVLNQPRTHGIVFQGHVSDSLVARNAIVAEPGFKPTFLGWVRAITFKGPDNEHNTFQDNRVSGAFTANPEACRSCCAFGNRDQSSAAYSQLSDTQRKPCVP